MAVIPKLLQSKPEVSVSFFGGDPLESWDPNGISKSSGTQSETILCKCVFSAKVYYLQYSIVERPVRGRCDDNTFPCLLLVGFEKQALLAYFVLSVFNTEEMYSSSIILPDRYKSGSSLVKFLTSSLNDVMCPFEWYACSRNIRENSNR